MKKTRTLLVITEEKWNNHIGWVYSPNVIIAIEEEREEMSNIDWCVVTGMNYLDKEEWDDKVNYEESDTEYVAYCVTEEYDEMEEIWDEIDRERIEKIWESDVYKNKYGED